MVRTPAIRERIAATLGLRPQSLVSISPVAFGLPTCWAFYRLATRRSMRASRAGDTPNRMATTERCRTGRPSRYARTLGHRTMDTRELDDVIHKRQEDPLLRPAQVAEMLGVKMQTLALWRCRTGQGKRAPSLPWVKIGRRSIRYRLSAVKSYLAANAHGGDCDETKQPAQAEGN